MTGYVIAGVALLLPLAVVAYDRWRTACTIRQLDEMLTAAMDGRFSEQNFDESRLSALESRLARYLTASALSERNVREQKDQISALISDISHQTKTPVANLQLYAQLLSEQPLTAQGKDCAAAIRVSDTGLGISKGEQAKIFGRFYRAPGAYQAEGVGIGLYLTGQIAEKQGGYVKVESTPGKGSAFSLYIPRET